MAADALAIPEVRKSAAMILTKLTILYKTFENYTINITATSPRGQRVKGYMLWNLHYDKLLLFLARFPIRCHLQQLKCPQQVHNSFMSARVSLVKSTAYYLNNMCGS